jgi:hypothetical protein
MIILAGLVAGALTGALVARSRGGKRLDILHYAAGFGIAFGILGTFVTVALSRMLL